MEELKIKFESKTIESKNRKLRASFSLDAMQDITALHKNSIDFKRIEQEMFDKEMSEKLDALGF